MNSSYMFFFFGKTGQNPLLKGKVNTTSIASRKPNPIWKKTNVIAQKNYTFNEFHRLSNFHVVWNLQIVWCGHHNLANSCSIKCSTSNCFSILVNTCYIQAHHNLLSQSISSYLSTSQTNVFHWKPNCSFQTKCATLWCYIKESR